MESGSDSARAVVNLTIVLLCAGALVLMGLVLGGAESSETGLKVLGTAIAVALFGVLALPGVALLRSPSALSLLGAFTAVIALLGLIAMVATVWTASFTQDHWRPFAYLTIVALAASFGALLLASARPEDGDGERLARGGAVAALVALVPLVLIEISEPGRDVGLKPIAVVAVLFVLGSAALAVLRLAAPPRG